jgi:hypothetical protein
MPSTFSVISCVVLCFFRSSNAFAFEPRIDSINPLKDMSTSLTWSGPPGMSTSFDLTG